MSRHRRATTAGVLRLFEQFGDRQFDTIVTQYRIRRFEGALVRVDESSPCPRIRCESFHRAADAWHLFPANRRQRTNPQRGVGNAFGAVSKRIVF